MTKEINFKSVVIDGAIFIFAIDKENTLIGVAEASRLSEKEDENIYFFNRLYIQDKHRGNGYSKKLLEEFCKKVDEEKINVDLTINSYGDVTYEKLKELYERYGFKQVGENHFLRNNKSCF